jgi:hypothetical protein
MASLLPPEHRLVLLTAGGARNDAAIRELLERELDWGRVNIIARRERAWPVIWPQLARLGAARIPESIESAIQRLAMVYDFRLTYLESRLWDTLSTFERHGIEVMLLKGSALAVSIYPSFRERPMGDVDILVHPGAAERAWRLAQNAGWRWPADDFPLHMYERHHHWPPLIDRRERGACLEIHTQPIARSHPFALPLDGLWREAAPVSSQRPLIVAPHPLTLLLHTCIHFAWSHRLGLGAWRTFRDVRSFIEAEAVDWAAFVDLAREARAGTCAYWTLRLAHDLAHVPVPMQLIATLRPRGSEFLVDRLERHFALSLFPAERVCPSVLAQPIWELAIRPKLSGHGSIRPWKKRPKPSHGAVAAVRHAAHWRLWLQYVRGLVLPATTRS